jgi:hypothetical protein
VLLFRSNGNVIVNGSLRMTPGVLNVVEDSTRVVLYCRLNCLPYSVAFTILIQFVSSNLPSIYPWHPKSSATFVVKNHYCADSDGNARIFNQMISVALKVFAINSFLVPVSVSRILRDVLCIAYYAVFIRSLMINDQ